MRPGRFLLAAVLVLVCVGGFGAEPTGPAELPKLAPPDFKDVPVCTVLRAVDGDTIQVQGKSGIFKVRLIGVDTPETVHPAKPVEAYGKEASRFTANLLKGEKVYVVIDPQQGETDRYGRTLAYIYRFPDGLFINAELVRQGYAHAYVKYPFRYMEQFRQLEAFARQAKKGLWAPDGTGASPGNQAAPTTAPSTATPAVAPAEAPTREPVPKPTPTVTAKPAPGGQTVFITRTGQKYHAAGCRYLAKSSIPMSLTEAKQRYAPCSVCNPPQ